MKHLPTMGITACLLGALFAACSSGPSDQQASGSNGAAGTAGAGSGNTPPSGSGDQADVGFGPAGVGGFSQNGADGAGSGAGGDNACAGETSKAELIPLDIYLMLDSSGSMDDKTGANGQGVSKWNAVTTALAAFFKDPQSAGLGVGLQHFPLNVAGIPKSCTANAQCPGASGPCLLKACAGTQVITGCTSNADCGGKTCVTLGRCGDQLCGPPGVTCPSGLKCVQLTSSTCSNPYSCVVADYAAPEVDISALPGAAPSLTDAIAAITPIGGTPTSAALQGALNHAQSYAKANPTHTVIALLATDGLPTECSPTSIDSIAQIAAEGAQGTPAVKTFVIGVFAAIDTQAPSNLNKIAAAGGTDKAFIVDTSQDVTQAFLDALNAIRGTKLACEYEVPQPKQGESLDFGKVNVEYTPTGSSKAVTVPYVAGGAAACDPAAGGWYYDVDPIKGGTPTKIIMCSATCDAFGKDAGGQVDIRVGCKTVVLPPK